MSSQHINSTTITYSYEQVQEAANQLLEHILEHGVIVSDSNLNPLQKRGLEYLVEHKYVVSGICINEYMLTFKGDYVAQRDGLKTKVKEYAELRKQMLEKKHRRERTKKRVKSILKGIWKFLHNPYVVLVLGTLFLIALGKWLGIRLI